MISDIFSKIAIAFTAVVSIFVPSVRSQELQSPLEPTVQVIETAAPVVEGLMVEQVEPTPEPTITPTPTPIPKLTRTPTPVPTPNLPACKAMFDEVSKKVEDAKKNVQENNLKLRDLNKQLESAGDADRSAIKKQIDELKSQSSAPLYATVLKIHEEYGLTGSGDLLDKVQKSGKCK